MTIRNAFGIFAFLCGLIFAQPGLGQSPDDNTAAAGEEAQATAPAPGGDTATRPERERPQDITVIADTGGVLTPGGTLTIEPILSASHTSSNRFFFQGVEIVDAVLIGAVEATESRRNYISPKVNVRFGLTDRIEIFAKFPYVYRDDRVESTIISEDPDTEGEPTFLQNLDGSGLGDIEFGAQAQLNDGRGGWPYFILNLRGKSTTGTGPYEVDRNEDGIEQELSTGSGFWSVEPSLTMIYQSDPAVFFTNIGYIWNKGDDVDLAAGDQRIGHVNPGDTVTGSIGIGFALNQELSVNMGYQHNYVFGTTSIINDNLIDTNDFQVGSFLFGMNLGIGKLTGLSMNLGVGVTDDSPDVEFTLRMPFSFALFE